MMERWNDGLKKDMIHFNLHHQAKWGHQTKAVTFQKPFFQYSSIPIFRLERTPGLLLC